MRRGHTRPVWLPPLTRIPTVFKYLRYESSPVSRRTERPQPRPPVRRGPPGVPGPGVPRRHAGADRRRGRILQGRGVLAVRQQGRPVPGPARGPHRRARRAERAGGSGPGRLGRLHRPVRPGPAGRAGRARLAAAGHRVPDSRRPGSRTQPPVRGPARPDGRRHRAVADRHQRAGRAGPPVPAAPAGRAPAGRRDRPRARAAGQPGRPWRSGPARDPLADHLARPGPRTDPGGNMTTTSITGLDLLRARMSAAIGTQMPGHLQRLGWSAEQLAAFQRDRLRPLLARAVERSPFHAARLRGVDPDRFELADLPRLPVMTKAQLMEHFDAAVTDPRLTRDLVERHLAGSAAEPSLLLDDYVPLVSGGSSGLRGVFVQTIGEYADFACSIMRRPMAAAMTAAGPPPEGLVIGIVGAGSPVHSSGLGTATATAPPVRMIPAPASLPTAEIVRRLNAAQPPALMAYGTKLAELAREQREGRLRLNLRSVTSMAEMLSPAER